MSHTSLVSVAAGEGAWRTQSCPGAQVEWVCNSAHCRLALLPCLELTSHTSPVPGKLTQALRRLIPPSPLIYLFFIISLWSVKLKLELGSASLLQHLDFCSISRDKPVASSKSS